MIKKFQFVIAVLFFLSPALLAQQKTLLIRCDDIGMSHAVNMAAKELMESGIPFSASVMFTCPWYQEAVDLLKQHPEISVGVHLTLNAEWKNYRWGPVTGKNAVPSLVDSTGYFTPSRALFEANKPKLKEIEKELRAQVERAMKSGLKISYLDHHMSTAVDRPEYRKIVEKLAREYHLGISNYFQENYLNTMYNDPVDKKADSLKVILSDLSPDRVNLLVCHIGHDTPELQAMIDLNSFGLKEMSKHRQAELNALLSLKKEILGGGFRLVNYEKLISERGLKSMTRPVE
ncbi:MAG TPA: ChbG/HpnK family deacetylase [Ignavibacteriales bacterium]|nr:ChbG/HpnK family deacetylase [Ignavibacteriales bacterium]